MNRREFLGAAAAMTVAGCGSPGRPDDPTTIPVVDTHQHLWDLGRLRLPWLAGGGPLARNYLPEDYAEAFRGVPLAQSIYMEVDVAADQKDAEAEYVISLCERREGPTRAAVIGGRPADPGFAQYIDRHGRNPKVKGVRQVLFGGGALNPAFVQGIRLLGDRHLLFDLCLPPKDLHDAVKLVDLCPETRFVVDHCGNADVKAFMKNPPSKPEHEGEVWRRGMEALAARKNVICKISGIIARVPKPTWGPEHLAPIVDACLEAFGPDRVVFGSDWPVCTVGATAAQWVAALREIVRSRPEQQQRKLFHDNAVRFYALG